VVIVIVLVTDRVPELSNPLMVTGLADAAPAISALVKEKTPLANSMDAVVAVGTPARGSDGAVGLVILAFQLVQTKPWYVVRTASSTVPVSKFIVPTLTKISVSAVPSVEELPLELLFEDLLVGPLVDDGPLVDFRVGDLVDLVVGALVDFRVGDLVDLEVEELLRTLASWTSAVPLQMTERRRKSVFICLEGMVKEIDKINVSESKL
jgi:hypothetical protein